MKNSLDIASAVIFWLFVIGLSTSLTSWGLWLIQDYASVSDKTKNILAIVEKYLIRVAIVSVPAAIVVAFITSFLS